MSKILFLIHAATTLFMVGLIWFVQVVHYPLFSSVDRPSFPDYERLHMVRTTWVVGPVMLAEAITASLLALIRPTRVPSWLVWSGLGLLVVVWLSTALYQAPLHPRLAQGFDPALHSRLVRSNWVRTIAWTGRGLLVLAMAGVALRD